MLLELKKSHALAHDPEKYQTLKSLIKMYQGVDSRYLNFYGPAGTIPTVSYCDVIQQMAQPVASEKQIEFSGKAVFIGYSERWVPNHKDGFPTAYSQSSGVDISGVEMTATAFANLLENMPIHPLHWGFHGSLVFLWGLGLGLAFYFLPTRFSALTLGGTSIFYLVHALYQFKYNGTWFPVMIPLVLESPAAFLGAVLWKYSDTNKERQNIRQAFGYYLPNTVIDQLVKNISLKKNASQVVYGTCLCTDAGQYTSLSETMSPKALSILMHHYYRILFKPVKQNSGIVINIVGDAMLALWAKTDPDPSLRNQACLAALDISKAVQEFNHSAENPELPTRIGLHYGQISLGNVGAIDHYEYRPTGDIVNTSSRMEGLNKYLGTRILVSGEVMDQLTGFLTRGLGRFFLLGKTLPVEVFELICPINESSDRQRKICKIFSRALQAYKNQSWEKASCFFNQTIQINGQDGPSHFYLKQLGHYLKFPPPKTWDGVVYMDKK